MNNKISIVVPIYNAEKTINRCIDSIISQTYKNYEIILINDGSNDKSKDICALYNKMYSNIIVLDTDNEGVSAARNKGIKIASGEYIGFVDSDDYIDSNMLESLISIATQKDIDMIICGYSENDNIFQMKKDISYINIQEALDNIVDGGKFKGFVWNKLFKTSIIRDNNIVFNNNIHMCEDLMFCIDYLEKSYMIGVSNETPYHYINNNFSVSRSGFSEKRFSIIYAYDYLIEKEFIKNYPSVRLKLKNRQIRHCISLYKLLLKCSNVTDKKKEIKKRILNYKFKDFFKSNYNLKCNLMFIVLKIFRGKYD